MKTRYFKTAQVELILLACIIARQLEYFEHLVPGP